MKIDMTKVTRCVMICIFLFILISFIQNVQAACRISGYAEGQETIEGYCEKADDLKITTKDAGELWLFSWGGPSDTCESKCGDVYIRFQVNGETKIYKFDSSTPGWNEEDTHEDVNMTAEGQAEWPVKGNKVDYLVIGLIALGIIVIIIIILIILKKKNLKEKNTF